jgi:hypothetical protein
MTQILPGFKVADLEAPFEAEIAKWRQEVERSPHPHSMLRLARVLNMATQFEEALEWIDRAAVDPNAESTVEFFRGQSLLGLGRYDEAWPHFEARRVALDLNAEHMLDPPGPKWDGKTTDRPVLVFQEGGFGDTFMMIRYYKMLSERCIPIMMLDKHMHELLIYNGIPKETLFHWKDEVAYNAQCSLWSLPAILKKTLLWSGTYLGAPPDKIEKWKHLRGRVGFCGMCNERTNPLRQIPQEIAQPFIKYNDLFELTPKNLGYDWADAAGAIANLRLVIAVDTGIVHLAAAMGRPVLIMVSRWPEWRWLREGYLTPWYGTVRVVRQDEGGWIGLLSVIAEAAKLPYSKIEPIKLTPRQQFLARFDLEHSDLLGPRAKTFRKVFEDLKEDPLIVETGTLRTPGSWYGDGNSTVLFDEYCQALGGEVWSVDLSPTAKVAAQPLVSSHTTLFTRDSVQFLETCIHPDCKIDLLYLDSLDGHLPDADSHQLAEFQAAQRLLSSGSIVLIDDISTKGRRLIPYMDDVVKAPRLVEGDTQIAWRMP